MLKKVIRPFSLEERNEIQKGLIDGLNYAEIGRKLGRVRSSIGYEVRRMGGVDHYDASQAHSQVTTPKSRSYLHQKMNVLEEHIKTIYEIIKEIKNDIKNN